MNIPKTTSSWGTGWIKTAREALTKRNKFIDSRGLNTKKNHSYSSFWMSEDTTVYKPTAVHGKSGKSISTINNLAKLVKLSNYRRAIANFVKIVTSKDIPVLWASGNSCTDGNKVYITTGIKDSNFDVMVGLALHEASHIKLTDFKLPTEISDCKHMPTEALLGLYDIRTNLSMSKPYWRTFMFQMLNWVEDRRIDHYIFSTSPGYKAYYHKLYDYYWNDKNVHKGLLSNEFSNPQSPDAWMFHIINSINPSFKPTAMVNLDKVMEIIDLKNIQRLKSTESAYNVVLSFMPIILDSMDFTQPIPEEGTPKEPGKSGKPDDNKPGRKVNLTPDDANKTGNQVSLTPDEVRQILRALDKQKDFIKGDIKKDKASGKLAKALDRVAEQEIKVSTVLDGKSSALIQNCTNERLLIEFKSLSDELQALRNNGDTSVSNIDTQQLLSEQIENLNIIDYLDHAGSRSRYNNTYVAALNEGRDMGELLGRKLQLRNESRELVSNRLRNGAIDNKRLAAAGYGIESIFNQVVVDKHKKVNLHLSLDGSGSMSGVKWEACVRLTAAIAKAAKYCQNIDVQVSIRVTTSSGEQAALTLLVYDSKKNSLKHIYNILELFAPSNVTPEGICFESMIKQNILVAGSEQLDSYFLNISDGQPCMNSYGGNTALQHTKKQVDTMRSQMNMKIVSYFVSERDVDSVTFKDTQDGRAFTRMYGADAQCVDSKRVMEIAKSLNKKFLSLS